MAGRNSIVKVMTLVAAVFCVMIFTSSAVYAYIDFPGKFGKGSNVWFGGELWVICEEDVVADDNTGQKGILLICNMLWNRLRCTEGVLTEVGMIQY